MPSKRSSPPSSSDQWQKCEKKWGQWTDYSDSEKSEKEEESQSYSSASWDWANWAQSGEWNDWSQNPEWKDACYSSSKKKSHLSAHLVHHSTLHFAQILFSPIHSTPLHSTPLHSTALQTIPDPPHLVPPQPTYSSGKTESEKDNNDDEQGMSCGVPVGRVKQGLAIKAPGDPNRPNGAWELLKKEKNAEAREKAMKLKEEEAAKKAASEVCDKDCPKNISCDGGCSRLIIRQHLWVVADGPGWQGSVQVHCLDCYSRKWQTMPGWNQKGEKLEQPVSVGKLSENKWSWNCKARWAERKGDNIVVHKRVQRMTCWKQGLRDIDATYSGASNKVRRKELKRLAEDFANALSNCVLRMTKVDQEYIMEGFDIQQQEIAKMADCEYYVPQLEEDEMTDWLCQYEDDMDAQGNIISVFLCRDKDCLYTCRSMDWPNTAEEGGGRYYCPMCAKLYSPFITSGNRVTANKLFVFKMSGKDDDANATAPDGQKFKVVPYIWLDTVGQAIEDGFKRVASGIREEIKKVPEEERLQYVVDSMEKRAIHPLFTHNMPTVEQVNQMRDRNKLKGNGQPNGKLNLARFEEKGSYGAYMKDHKELFANPLSNDDMMRNWIMSKISTENALRARDRKRLGA